MDGELITMAGGEARVSTLALAEGTQNEHASVILLTRKYVDDLREFGEVRFEIAPGYHNAQVEYALLNEDQATLLMTYMRNNEVVRGFKKALECRSRP
jgi:phage regulator Rha-like protein